MYTKLLEKIENPAWPLLGPNLWMLERLGLWETKSLYLPIAASVFVVTQYIELWIVKSNHESALRNLSVSLLATVCIAKAATFTYWKKNWREIIEFTRDYEHYHKSLFDNETDAVIKEYTKYSRSVNSLYAFLTTVTVINGIVFPLLTCLITDDPNYYPEIMSSWVPFNKYDGIGHYIYYLIQVFIFFWGGGLVWGYDTMSVTLMSFFTGHLKLLKINCKRIFDSKHCELTEQETLNNVKKIHICHVALVRNCYIMDSLLSPVMFLYVVICSLMICASAIRLTQNDISALELLWIVEYMIALIFQLFLYSWHCNEVKYMSEEVSYGVFSSDWPSYDFRFQRLILLLGGQLKKVIVFKAGPFTSLNVSTFVSILKASYSYYTLLK